MEKDPQKKQMQEMQKTILLLQGEVERLSSPPYMSATLIDMGKKTARVSIDGSGIYEIIFDDKLKEKVKKGKRIILNPQSKALIGSSEFEILGGDVVIVDEVLENRFAM